MDTLVRYCLLQVPGLLFLLALLGFAVGRDWIGGPAAATVVALWVLKDAVLYPWYRPSLEDGPRVTTDALVGEHAVVTRRLAPTGQVRLRQEWWRAQAADAAPLEPGTTVRIVGARGLVLIVSADATGAPATDPPRSRPPGASP